VNSSCVSGCWWLQSDELVEAWREATVINSRVASRGTCEPGVKSRECSALLGVRKKERSGCDRYVGGGQKSEGWWVHGKRHDKD